MRFCQATQPNRHSSVPLRTLLSPLRSWRLVQVSGYAIPAANLVQRLRLRMNTSSLTGSWYEQQWRQLIAPLHEAGVPYAAVLGE